VHWTSCSWIVCVGCAYGGAVADHERLEGFRVQVADGSINPISADLMGEDDHVEDFQD